MLFSIEQIPRKGTARMPNNEIAPAKTFAECVPAGCRSIHLFGLDLPVIADLPENHKLALHKNGPCIVSEHSISVLELAAGEPPHEMLLDDGEVTEDLPYEVCRAAIVKYVEWSWSRLRAAVFDGNPSASHERHDHDGCHIHIS
jgi:hypothetical protein